MPRFPRSIARTSWLVVLLAAGCATTGATRSTTGEREDGLQNAARARASAEIPCGASALQVRDLGSGGYRVEGCGQWMTYTCMKSAHGFLCSPNERGRMEIDPTAEWTDEDVELLSARVRDDLAACLPEALPSVALRLRLQADGHVVRAGVARLDDALASCVDRRLAVEHLGRVVIRPRVVDLTVTRPAVQPLGSTDAPPATPAIAPDAAARAAIEARAPSLLACVEADALSLQVSWDREGRLDALLRGDRQGSAEESCVRAIVQRLTISAPGAAGSIIHALQR